MREKPEPFYCAFRNRETYYPFNTLDAKMCERQCIKCECYQEGSNEFNPRHLPMHHYRVFITKWSIEIIGGIIHGWEVFIGIDGVIDVCEYNDCTAMFVYIDRLGDDLMPENDRF